MASGRSSAPTPARGMGGDFWKFFVGQTVSALGTSFTLFALPLLVFKLTGSALNLALVTAAEFLPYVLFGLLLGALADRVDRRRMLVVVDLARAALIGSIPLLAFVGTLPLWWIYAVAFANSTLWIFFDAAEFAAVPSLVGEEDIVAANGRIQAAGGAAMALGPLLAGLLVAVAPIETVLLFDALSFVVSAFSLWLVRTSFNEVPASGLGGTSLKNSVAEGLRYVWNHPVLRNVSLMGALVNCVGYTVYGQLVLFSKERLGAGDTQVGLLYAAGSAGVVALSLAAGPLRRRVSFGGVALGTVMLGGILILVLSFTRSYPLGVALWAPI